MSEDRIEKLEKSLRIVRTRVDELDHGQRGEFAALRFSVLASAVAGSMLALTATTWRTTVDDSDYVIGDVTTLWGMAPEGWQGTVTLLLVLTVSIGTIAVFLADIAGPITHFVFAALALFTVVGIVLLGALEPAGWGDPEDGRSGPGRWLTLLAALLLAIAHASRAEQVKHR
jgi:hypothetical protein